MDRCFFIAVVVATVFVYTVAKTSKGDCGKGVSWTLDEDTLVVVFSGKGGMGECNISYGFQFAIVSAIVEEGITSLPKFAFGAYGRLESVSLPKTLQSIGLYSFAGCNSLKQVNISEDNPYFTSIDDVIYDKGATTLYSFPCGKTDNFTTPDFVQTVGKVAFSSCRNLKTYPLEILS